MVCYYKDYKQFVYAALANKITNIIAILTAEKLLHLATHQFKFSFTFTKNIWSNFKPNYMNVKIDTKEKFTVIKPQEQVLSANMTAELSDLLVLYLQKDIPHIILKMGDVHSIDKESAHKLADLQQQFYEDDKSFVICELSDRVEELLEKEGLLDIMNVTPTESEAWDILQMEEIERELFNE